MTTVTIELWNYDSEYDNWESIVRKDRAEAINKIYPDGPQLTVVRMEQQTEYKDCFIYAKVPEPYNNEKGEAMLRWVDNPEREKAWQEWQKKGTDHVNAASYFVRTVEVPVYGYVITTLKDFLTITKRHDHLNLMDSDTNTYRISD